MTQTTTPHDHYPTPNFARRRALALGVVALGLLSIVGGVAYGKGQYDRVMQERHYVEHPETIPEGKYDTVTVQGGDTPTSIAKLFTGPDHDYLDLRDEISHQTDDQGNLIPGHTIHIERRLEYVDPNSAQ